MDREIVLWLGTTRLARHDKVTTQTIRRWVEDGHCEGLKRTKGEHNRLWVRTKTDTVLYCPVSRNKQTNSLDTHEQLLRSRYPNGLNFKRRKFVTLLERALRGETIHVAATTSDRIMRFGYPIIRTIIESSGDSIEVLEENGEVEIFGIRTLVA